MSKITFNWRQEKDYLILNLEEYAFDLSQFTCIAKIDKNIRKGATLIVTSQGKINSPINGMVKKITKEEIVIEKCQHDYFYSGLCTSCGEKQDDSNKNHYLTMSQTIHFSNKRAKEIEKEIINKLVINKKLILLLDIDNTILHSVNKNIYLKENEKDNKKEDGLNKDEQDQSQSQKLIKDFIIERSNNKFIVSFRPFLEKFLLEISSCYEIYVYTMGIESYVLPILKYLNSHFGKEYFSESRLIARDSQNNNISHKSINKIFPSNYNYCIILDDRDDVWKERESVIKIFPYWYFEDSPCGRVRKNQKDEDCFLELSSKIMKFLWKVFYFQTESNSQDDDNVYNIDKSNIKDGFSLSKLWTSKKKTIFKGETFYLINVNELQCDYINYIILSFGGRVENDFSKEVTIVLCGDNTFDIPDFMKEDNVIFLMCNYLIFCEAFYFKIDFDLFLYTNYPKIRHAHTVKDTEFLERYAYNKIYYQNELEIHKFYSDSDEEISLFVKSLNLLN